MKKSAFIPVLCLTFLSLLAGRTWAAEFTAETVVDRLGRPQSVKIFVKNQKIRQEMEDSFGQEQVFIADPEAGLAVIYYPANKSYMKMPAVGAVSPVGNDEAALKKIGRKTVLGRTRLNGYLCERFDLVYHNTFRGRMKVWWSLKLDFPILMIQEGGGSAGFRRELTNIEERPLSEDLFRLPPNSVEIKKPAQGFCGAGVCSFSIY